MPVAAYSKSIFHETVSENASDLVWDWIDLGANSVSCLVINTIAFFFGVSSMPACPHICSGGLGDVSIWPISFSFAFLIRIVRARWGWNYSAKLIFRIFCIRKRFGFVHRLLNAKTTTRKHRAIQLLIAVRAFDVTNFPFDDIIYRRPPPPIRR